MRNDLCNMYYVANIITVVKSRKLKEAGNVARINIYDEQKR